MGIKSKVLVSFLFYSLFIPSVSCQKKSAEWQGTISEEDGVIVVKNPKEPIYNEPLFTVEEELVIGDAEEGEEPVFLQVRGFAIDDEENIYVLDIKAAQIKIFDKNGTFLRTIGKKGQGPGELSIPINNQITVQNEIIVQDIGHFSVYSLKGDFLKTISTAKLNIGPSRFDNDGNIYGIAIGVDAENRLYELKKFTSDQEYLYALDSSPLPKDGEWDLFFFLIRYRLRDDDCVIAGYPVDYVIKIFSPEGTLITKIEKDYDPVEITQEEIDKAKSELQKEFLQGREIVVPKYYPAYQAFGCDEKNRMYVGTFEKTEDGKGFFYDVFNEEGKYINKLPLNIRPWV
ncbi:6-bladed beta-propeller [Acidobacteriota bacterium]